MVDRRCSLEGAMSDCVSDNVLNLLLAISKFLQRDWNRLVDDLKVAAASQFLEFD
jgi:hypothetical protein